MGPVDHSKKRRRDSVETDAVAVVTAVDVRPVQSTFTALAYDEPFLFDEPEDLDMLLQFHQLPLPAGLLLDQQDSLGLAVPVVRSPLSAAVAALPGAASVPVLPAAREASSVPQAAPERNAMVARHGVPLTFGSAAE